MLARFIRVPGSVDDQGSIAGHLEADTSAHWIWAGIFAVGSPGGRREELF